MRILLTLGVALGAVIAAVERSAGENPVAAIEKAFLNFLAWFGDLASFCRKTIRAMFSPPFEWREFLRQFASIGAKSLPLVALAGAATGVVLSMQTRDSLARFGAKSMLPAVIIFSLIKETGPTITGLVVSGRVGAGIGAELGSMKVTEQVDAMEASAVDPHKFLAATRILACIVALPLLTLAADFCGIAMGWVGDDARRSRVVAIFPEPRPQRRGVQRSPGANFEDHSFRLHHRCNLDVSRTANDRRDRRRRQIRHQRRAAFVAADHPGGCATGPHHHHVFSIEAACRRSN